MASDPAAVDDDCVVSRYSPDFPRFDRVPGNPSPLHADLVVLPPFLIQGDSEEILRCGVEVFADRAAKAGVSTALEIWVGMWPYRHIFLSSLP